MPRPSVARAAPVRLRAHAAPDLPSVTASQAEREARIAEEKATMGDSSRVIEENALGAKLRVRLRAVP